jgi:transcriptional regulator with XRE-family HTH domain
MRRRRLAAELRRLRTEATLTVEEAAARLQWPGSKVSRIENRQVGVSPKDLRNLLDLYQVKDRAYREELLEVGRRATERGWWQSYTGLLPALGTLIGLEAEAATIRTYEPELIPGLLQTPDYARAVIRAAGPGDTMEQVNRGIEVRLERQEALTRTDPPPPKVSVVLNEGVLARRVGSPDVMRGQLEHLIRERDRANVVIQVLPFSSGEHPAMVGPFTMLTFLDPADPGVVNVENVLGALALEQPEEIRAYEDVWSTLQARAASPDDSRAIIKTYSLR